MRLTKGQLKRIIREEHSKLRRRGLLREFGPASAEDMADFEYDESGAAERNKGTVQKMMKAVEAELEKRKKRNVQFIQFAMNDLLKRMSRGYDEYLEKDDDKIYYNIGSVLQNTDTPFSLSEVDRFITSPIRDFCNDNDITISWSYSWD
jgi:hypothetical protein